MTATGLLSEFEQQFGVITAEITSNTSKVLNLNNDQFVSGEKLLHETKKLLDDCHELLEHMDLEVREASQDQREKLRNRVKCYESELKRLETEVKRSENVIKSKSEGFRRQELFAGGTEINLSSSQQQHQQLLSNTESLERTSVRLDHSISAALESELAGAQALNDLQSQRETLNRARERLHGTGDDLNQSWRTLTNMAKVAKQNKILVYVALITVLAIVIIIVVSKFV